MDTNMQIRLAAPLDRPDGRTREPVIALHCSGASGGLDETPMAA